MNFIAPLLCFDVVPTSNLLALAAFVSLAVRMHPLQRAHGPLLAGAVWDRLSTVNPILAVHSPRSLVR
jgi:hypothetical protein